MSVYTLAEYTVNSVTSAQTCSKLRIVKLAIYCFVRLKCKITIHKAH